jgi:ureidoglycolate hydrolase
MQAIEFQAIIKNGVIEIPRQYLRNLSNRVRVILLVEQTPKTTVNFIDQLLAHPVRVQGFRPLTREEIYAR